MKFRKIPSLILAALLQVLPIARAVFPDNLLPRSGAAIVFRWGVGAAAFLGSVDAVSGASTVITSPATTVGTNGVPFSYRITTGPQVASQFSASPLPSGLAVSTTTGRITGTPTQVGVTACTIQGCEPGNGCTPTATLTITIVAGVTATAPSITTQPVSQTVTAGGSATFTGVASGTAPLSYQWKFNGSPITGAASATLSLSNIQTTNAGSYSCTVSNSAGSVTSSGATLTVNIPVVAPLITTQPQNQSLLAGGSASFTVAASGTTPLSYQWRFNGAPITGATSATISLSNVQSANAGAYSVDVSNVAGSVTSSSATLTVTVAAVAPAISSQPASQTVTVGSSATVSIGVNGTAPFGYQWRFNGVPIAGATSATLALSNVQTNQAGSYSVVVSNAAGSVTSADAILTVQAQPSGGGSGGTPANVLELTVVGSGSVAPDLNGQSLVIGQSYTVKATPAPGYVFGGWSGTVSSAGPTLSFVMQSNMTLQAEFVANPFRAGSGKYNGLFYEESGATYEHSGLVTLTVKDTGKFKGALQIGATRYAFGGQFDTTGAAAVTAATAGQMPLTLTLQLDLTNNTDQITGNVSDGSVAAVLVSDRATFARATNPCPLAGNYSVVLPNADPTQASDTGEMIVTVTGIAKLKGSLADGTKLTERAPLSKNGDWPLYTRLRSGGALIGWVKVANTTPESLSANVVQLKPVTP